MKHLGSDKVGEFPPVHPADFRRARREAQQIAGRQAFDKASRELAAADPQPQPEGTAPRDNAAREMRFLILAANASYDFNETPHGKPRQRGENGTLSFSQGRAHTDDVATARRYIQRGLRVLDRRAGEPGGLLDEGMKHWRIEIQPGRRMAGKTFKDQSGLEFIAGVATTSHEPSLYTARDCDYEIVDQWAEATKPAT